MLNYGKTFLRCYLCYFLVKVQNKLIDRDCRIASNRSNHQPSSRAVDIRLTLFDGYLVENIPVVNNWPSGAARTNIQDFPLSIELFALMEKCHMGKDWRRAQYR